MNLGLGYLLAYAEKFGYNEIKCYKSPADIKFKKIPDIVGISSVTQNFDVAKEMIKNIKKISKNIKIILGGVHVSLLPMSAPRQTDYIVIGEGEEAFVELLDHITKKNRKIEDIKGVYYWNQEKDKFIFTGPREYMKNLEAIPYPKRSIAEIKKGEARVFSSRGCPYKCPFCASAHLWKNIRFFPVDYVIKELEIVIEKYNVKIVEFQDDLFTAHMPRLRQIATEIKKRGWDKRVSFRMCARANLVTEELADILKSINTINVAMGLETGSERMLKIMKGNTVTMKQNYDSVRILQSRGIPVMGFFMIGYPGETIEEIDMTFEFVKKTNIARGGTQVVIPFPGTELWDYALNKGLVSEDMEWKLFDVTFGKDHNKAIIISDIDRKILLDRYTKFMQIWMHKTEIDVTKVWKYFKHQKMKIFIELVKEPKKIFYLSQMFMIMMKQMVTRKS
jgi:anaerobic magnesium-protoporphyrin IX monomethyl ester cyclase